MLGLFSRHLLMRHQLSNAYPWFSLFFAVKEKDKRKLILPSMKRKDGESL